MGIVTNRRRVMGGKPLPYDSVVEYLESVGNGSNGGQYINTDVNIPMDCIHVEYHFAFMFTRNHKQVLFGHQNPSYQNPRTYAFYTNASAGDNRTFYAGNALGAVKIAANTLVNGYITIDTTENKFNFYNNDTLAFSKNLNGAALNTTYPVKIFAGCYGNNIDDSASVRIFNFSIVHGSTLVRDFITVRVGQVGYMYDRVSGQLFGNAGTGAFVVGPDVNN